MRLQPHDTIIQNLKPAPKSAALFHRNTLNTQQSVQFSGKSALNKNWTIDTMAKHLGQSHSLHGVNSSDRMAIYQSTPEYSVLDVDFWYDSKNKRLVVSHDRPTGNEPLLADWLEEFATLPKEKRVALQLDMKNKAAVKPLIEVLNTFKQRYAGIWDESMIIINGDIPIGDSHKLDLFNWQTWGVLVRQKLSLKTMTDIAEAFPDAVISLGVADYIKSVDEKMLKAIEKTLKKFSPQGKIFSIPAHIKVEQDLADLLKQQNTLIKFWSGSAHSFESLGDGEALRKSVQLPENTPHWIEF